MGYVVGVDIGGTFTDLVAIDAEGGETIVAKEASVPSDFVRGVSAAIERAGLAELAQFRHATTVGTNAIIERRGARTALVTTAGFRDVLLAGRANKPDLYDSDWDPPAPLVPRQWIFGVPERLDYAGRVVRPLDQPAVARVADRLRELEIEAVAICFLNSFMNGAHEAEAKEIVTAGLPGAFVCTSHEVLPEIREFERTSTTVANAYLGPSMSSYLERLATSLARRSGSRLNGELLVSHSGGGLMTVSSAGRLPARICQSGPAAGVMGARDVARRLGHGDAISLDMGGTSADIAAIVDAAPAFRNEWHIEFNIPIIFPAVDLVTIGAGGGTIAWVDSTGALRSGPQSAGADPGPACYGHGGTEPTNTDANLVLGRLRADSFLGGRMRLDVEAAERAISDRVGSRLGLKLEEAAAGILRLSNTAMLGAMRLMTTQRGYDPRRFTLVAFGGAGALHAADLAAAMGIRRIVVPRLPGLMSARGILSIDVRHDLVEPLFERASSLDRDRFAQAMTRLVDEAEGLRRRDSSIARWRLERSVDVRYFGQISGYLNLPLGEGPAEGAALADRFEEEHAREFGYRLPKGLAEVELVNLRAALIGEVDRPSEPAFAPGPRREEATVDAHFPGEGTLATTLADREGIAVGERLEGPAVITEWASTTVVPPGAVAWVEDGGELSIELPRRAERA
jgi:N-methylhydantoinase A